jgi:methionyl aminopeptidase
MVVTAERDIAGAAIAAEKVVETHRRLVDFLRPGLRLAEIDAFVAATLEELGCRSAFLGYRTRGHPPFPSHACISVNECIVHGTHDMTERPIQRGDVVSIDIGVKCDGWIGDAAWTYGIVEVDDIAYRLMRCGRESLRLGVAAMRPGRPMIDWAKVVQNHVEKRCGFCLVRGLGGHGYGRELHGPPFISNVVPSYDGEWPDAWKPFTPGMLVAVEPMLAVSTTEIRSEGRAWPIFSADRSLTVHYEADVLITAEGPRDLTAGLHELPDLVGR